MIARLILMLLLAAFALPAMASAPCHDGSAEMAGMAMPHVAPPLATAPAPDHERPAVATHACMGCIPPSSLRRATVAAPLPYAMLRTRHAALHFDHGRTGPPATPPPRSNA